MASNFSVGMIGVIVVVMLLQLYKIQSLGGELQNQVISSDQLKQSLVKDVESCEQRLVGCNNVVAALKKDHARENKQVHLQVEVVEERLRMTEFEKENLEKQLQKLQAETAANNREIAVKDKERENAMKEAERYRGLYEKGNEILNAMRKENERLKSLTAKPVGQILSDKGAMEVKARVERTVGHAAKHDGLPSRNTLEKQPQGQNEAKEIEQKETRKTEQEVKKEGKLKENVNAEQKKTGEVKKEEHEKEIKGMEAQGEKIETDEKKKEAAVMEKPMVVKEEAAVMEKPMVVKEEVKKEAKREAAEQGEAEKEGEKNEGEVEEKKQHVWRKL